MAWPSAPSAPASPSPASSTSDSASPRALRSNNPCSLDASPHCGDSVASRRRRRPTPPGARVRAACAWTPWGAVKCSACAILGGAPSAGSAEQGGDNAPLTAGRRGGVPSSPCHAGSGRAWLRSLSSRSRLPPQRGRSGFPIPSSSRRPSTSSSAGTAVNMPRSRPTRSICSPNWMWRARPRRPPTSSSPASTPRSQEAVNAVAAAQQARDAARAAAADATTHLQTARAEAAAAHEVLRRQAIDAYVGQGRFGVLSVTLQPTSQEDALTASYYAQLAGGAQASRLEAAQATREAATAAENEAAVAAARAASTETDLTHKQAAVQQARDAQAAAQQHATDEVAQEEQVLADLQQQQSDYSAQITELQAESQQIATLLRQRARQQQRRRRPRPRSRRPPAPSRPDRRRRPWSPRPRRRRSPPPSPSSRPPSRRRPPVPAHRRRPPDNQRSRAIRRTTRPASRR